MPYAPPPELAGLTLEQIAALVRAHVERVAPAGVTVTVEHLHGGKPWRADLQGPIIDAGKAALLAAFGRDPVITGEGGTFSAGGNLHRLLANREQDPSVQAASIEGLHNWMETIRTYPKPVIAAVEGAAAGAGAGFTSGVG